MVQLSHLYVTTGKTITLTIQTFVGKVIPLFNMLSRFAIDFLPSSKFQFLCLLLFVPSLKTGGCVYPREIYTPDKLGLL